MDLGQVLVMVGVGSYEMACQEAVKLADEDLSCWNSAAVSEPSGTSYGSRSGRAPGRCSPV